MFLTEGFADKNIPLRETSTYYVHVCVNPKKYLGKVKKLIDVRYLQESMDNDNYDFVLDRDNCTELDSGVLYDNKSGEYDIIYCCLLYTSPSPRDVEESRMPSSA